MNKQMDKYIKQYTQKRQENIVPALSQGTFSKNITNAFPLQNVSFPSTLQRILGMTDFAE